MAPPVRMDFTMEAGEDWVRSVTLAVTNPTDIVMDIRNANLFLVSKLSLANGKATITLPSTVNLHLLTSDTLNFGSQFPGTLQAINYWGIGRAYLYDIFVKVNGLWTKVFKGFVSVDPAISQGLG